MSDHTPFFPKNLEDYAPWVATHGLVAPYGQCQCGCGQDTNLCKTTKKERGLLAGAPSRFLSGHNATNPLSAKEIIRTRSIINPETGCWEWQKPLHIRGYGQVCHDAKQVLAHRFSYETFKGEIPDGLHVCHTCDNRKCVNPDHLWLGTNADNTTDKVRKGRHVYGTKAHCAKLSDEKVLEIVNLVEGGMSQGKVAKMYGISQPVVSRIMSGESWAHVTKADTFLVEG